MRIETAHAKETRAMFTAIDYGYLSRRVDLQSSPQLSADELLERFRRYRGNGLFTHSLLSRSFYSICFVMPSSSRVSVRLGRACMLC